MLNDTVYPILFGAYSISQVSSVNGEERVDRMLWNTERAELHVVTSRQQPQYPKNYTVVSEVPIIVEDELRTKSADALYTNNPAEDKYLQLPSRFPERVKDLAAEVTATAKHRMKSSITAKLFTTELQLYQQSGSVPESEQ